ncbi:TetR/AcrR family transcriptional regulator [Streptomyces sp. NPDC097619]|uniref:TetR/AcrR family transcriptional regulator n=1 Tax=Streptomyces sp. NPDC097619 TaxID=3157228 RepID=UPI00331A8D75
MTPPPPPPDPARRNERASRAITTAALELCREIGYAKVSVDAIAARAGASKATIYRWWPHKGAVLLDAFLEEAADDAAFPDTGDLVADLRTQMNSAIAAIGGPSLWPHYTALIGEAQHRPELAEAIYERFIGPLEDAAAERIRAAQALGQVDPGLDPYVLVDLLYGALYYALLLVRKPADPAYVDTLLATAFRTWTPRPPEPDGPVAPAS